MIQQANTITADNAPSQGLAAQLGFVRIGSHIDEVDGFVVMTKDERSVPWVSLIRLKPRITYGGENQPTSEEEEALHHLAYEQCFIANSIKTEVTVVRPGDGA